MTEVWMIWILVAIFIYYAIFTAIDTIATTKQKEINYKFAIKVITMTIFVGASPVMMYQAIIEDIHFFDIFLESGLKTIFHLLIITAPLHLIIFRKKLSENIKKATTNIGYG